jgi:hypothetical protein
VIVEWFSEDREKTEIERGGANVVVMGAYSDYRN